MKINYAIMQERASPPPPSNSLLHSFTEMKQQLEIDKTAKKRVYSTPGVPPSWVFPRQLPFCTQTYPICTAATPVTRKVF